MAGAGDVDSARAREAGREQPHKVVAATQIKMVKIEKWRKKCALAIALNITGKPRGIISAIIISDD